MCKKIVIKDIEPVRVAYKSYKGNVLEAGKQMPTIFQSIKGKNNGVPFYCIHHVNESTGIGEMDLCIPTMEKPTSSDVFTKELSRIYAVSIIHKGGYDTLPEAYHQIEQYIDENKFKTVGPTREVYIKGPGLILKGNPNNYITEILIPIEKNE